MKSVVFWNVSLLPIELQSGILDVLKRDYDYIWDDIKDREDDGYPVVLVNDELCWKRDNFMLDAFNMWIFYSRFGRFGNGQGDAMV